MIRAKKTVSLPKGASAMFVNSKRPEGGLTLKKVHSVTKAVKGKKKKVK